MDMAGSFAAGESRYDKILNQAVNYRLDERIAVYPSLQCDRERLYRLP